MNHSSETNETMKALQILQTIMLAVMLAVGGWSLKTLIENEMTLSRIEPQLNRVSAKQEYVLEQLEKLRETDAALDKRVTVIETKVK